MKHVLLMFLLLTTSLVKADTKLSLMGSLNYSTPEFEDDNGIDEGSDIGFGIGFRALMGINDQLRLRSGASIVQKQTTYDTTANGSDVNLTFVYLNVPLTLYWQASSQVGFFGGTALNAKLSDDCDVSGPGKCNLDNEKTLVFPAIIGFDFSMSEKLGMEISYEYGLTETAKDLQIHTAVISLLYHLD